MDSRVFRGKTRTSREKLFHVEEFYRGLLTPGELHFARLAAIEINRAKQRLPWFLLLGGNQGCRMNWHFPRFQTARGHLDSDALHVQKLFEAQSHRDLTWFFDDWVYRDRGLPDFRIASVYSRDVLGGGQLATVTVENLGGAAAEVAVTLHLADGEASEKLIVPGKSKASVRILAGSTPLTATVNDGGGVPETDMSNNEYKIESLAH